MKRIEVKIVGKDGYHWQPAVIIGEEDGMYIVEHRDLYGKVREGMFWPQSLREVDAEVTDELLKEAARAAVREIKLHTVMIDEELLETIGKDVLQALRLRFGYPS